MNDALVRLLRELLDGPAGKMCFVLNPGDPGLLRSLDRLSAAEASRIPPDRTSSVAAHVDHLLYGFTLFNRWSEDENPFPDADFSASWTRTRVSEEEWAQLRGELRKEAEAWSVRLGQELPDDKVVRTGAAASVVHLAYHIGAIRQMAPELAGPRAAD